MAFFRQLQLLLWKNGLGIFRRPIWSITLILWPIIIFIIIAVTRYQFPPILNPTCYVGPRNLPSTGFFPFLETLMCNTDSDCHNTSRLAHPKPSRSRRSQPSAESPLAKLIKGRDLKKFANTDMQNGPTELLNKMYNIFGTPSSGSMAAYNHTFSDETVLNLTQSAADLKLVVCTIGLPLVTNPPQDNTAAAFLTFCKSNNTVFEVGINTVDQILIELMRTQPEELAKLAEKAVKFINQLQNETSLWEIFIVLPHIFNPESPEQLLVNLDILLTNLQRVLNIIEHNFPEVKNVTSSMHQFLVAGIRTIYYMQNWPGKAVSIRFGDVVTGNESLWQVVADIEIPLDQAIALAFDRNMVHDFVCKNISGPMWVAVCGTGSLDTVLSWISSDKLFQQIFLAWSKNDVAKHDFRFIEGMLHSLTGIFEGSRPTRPERNVETQPQNIGEELFLEVGKVVKEILRFIPEAEAVFQQILFVGFQSMKTGTQAIVTVEEVIENVVKDVTTVKMIAQTLSTSQPQTIIWISRALNSSSEIIWKIIAGHPVTLDTILDEFEWVFVFKTIKKDVVQSILCGNTTIIEQTLGKDWMPLIKNVQELFSVFMNQTTSNVSLPMVLSEWHKLLNKSLGFGGFLQKLEEDWTGEYWMDWISENTIASHLPASLQQSVLDFMVKFGHELEQSHFWPQAKSYFHLTLWILDFTDPALPNCTLNMDTLGHDCDANFDWYRFSHAVTALLSPNEELLISYLKRSVRVLQHIYSDFYKNLAASSIKNAIKGGDMLSDFLINMLNQVDEFAHTLTTLPNKNFSNPQVMTSLYVNLLESIGLKPLVPLILQDGPFNVSQVLEVISKLGRSNQGIFTFNESDPTMAELEELIVNFLSLEGNVSFSFYISMSQTMLSYYSYFTPEDVAKLKQAIQPFTNQTSSGLAEAVLTCVELLETIMSGDPTQMTLGYIRQIQHFLVSLFRMQMIEQYELTGGHFIANVTNLQLLSDIFELLTPEMIMNLTHTGPEAALHLIIQKYVKTLPPHVRPEAANFLHAFVALQGELAQCASSQDCLTGTSEMLDLLDQILESTISANLNVTINIGSTKMYKEREHIIDVANAFFSLILQSTDAVYVKTVREILQFISMLLRQPNIDLDHIQEALKANLTTEELNNLVQWLGAKDVKDLLEKVAQLQAAQKCFEGTSPASIAHCAVGMVSSITGFLMHLPVLQSHKPIISMIPVIVNQTVTGMIDINFTSSPQGALEEALKVTLASVEQTLHRINMSNHEIQRELEVLKNIIKLVGNPAPLKHLNATQDEINSGEAPLKMILWYLERLENVTSRSSVSHLLYPYFRIAQIQVALQLSQMDLTQFIVDQVWYLSDSLEYPIDAKGVVKIANATATILEHVLKFVAESLEAQNAPSILFGYDTQINMTFVNTIMLQINNYINVLEDWITEANINSWGNLNYSSMLQNDIYKLTQSTLDFFNVDHRGYIQAIRNLTQALDNVLMLALHPNGFQSKQFIYAIQEAVQSAMNLLIRINGPLPPVIQQSVLNLIGNAVGLAVHPEASYAMSLNATLHILHDLRVLINQIFPQEVTQYVMFPLEMITTYFESVSTLSGPDSFNQLILNEMETLESLLPPNSTAQLYISTIFNISKAILQPIQGNRTLHGPLEKRVSYIYTQVGDALNMLCPLFMSCERLNVSSLVGVSDLQHVLEKLLSGQDVFSDVFQIVQSVLRLFNVHQQGYMQAVGNLTQALDNALMFALQPNGLQSVQFSNALMRALQSLMDLLIQIDDPLTASSQHSLLNVIENAVWLAVHTEASFATSLNATLHLLQNVHLLTYQILPQEFAQYIAFPLKLIITYFETVASASGPDSVNQLILNEMETIESLLPPNSSEHHYVSTVFNITKAILQNVPGNGSLHGPLEQSIPYIYAEVGKLLNMLCPLFMSCKPLNTSSLEGFADLPHVLQKLMTGQASNETWRKLQEYFGVLLSFVEPEMSHADLACFVEMFEDVIETEVRKRKAEIGLILSLQTPIMGLITNFTHSLNGSHFNVSEVFERFEVAVEQTIKEIEKTNGTLSCQEVLNIWDPVREASGLNSSFMAMWCNVSLQPVIDAYVDDISQMSQNWTCTATGNVSAVAAASRIVRTLRSLYHAEFKHSDVIGLFVDALYTHFTVLVQQPLSPTAQHGLTMQLQRWQIQSSLRSLKLLSDQLENQFPTLKPYMDTVEKMVAHIVKNHQRMEESEEVFKEAAMILLSSLGVTTDDMNQILSGSFSSSSWVELVLDVMETVIDMNIFGDNPELYHTLNQLIASNDTTMVLHKVAEMIAWFASTEVKGVKFVVQTLTKMEELLGSLLKIFTNMDEDLSPSLHELQNLIRSAIAFIQQLLKSGSVPMGHHYSVSPGAMSSHNGSRVRHRRDAPFQPMNGIMDDVVDLFYIDYTTMFRALQVSPTPDEFLETAHVFFANPDLNLVLKESTKDLHSGINISREETIDAVLLVASLLTNPGTDYSSLDLWVQVVNMIPDDFPFVPLLKEVMQALARENHENLNLMQNTLNTVGVLFRIDPTDPQILRQLKQLNEQVCDLEQTSTIQTLEQGLSLENGILCDGIVPGVRILVEGLFFNMSRLLDDVFELFIGEPTMYHIQTNWTSAVTEGLGLNLTGLSSLNFTSHAAAVSIGDIVWNKTALEQDLERFGFHPDDVVLLTETVLPDNNLEIFSWLVHLRNCDSQHYNMTGGGEESLQNAFCSMDAEHWFGFTLLMAKHLNTEKFIIRMLLPREIQSLIQTMLRMTSSVITMMVDLLPAMGQLEGYMSSFESLNFAANNEFRQTSRMQRTAMSSGATFVTISRALCSRGILALFGVAKNPHASVSPPSFDHHPKREEMIERFKIPRNATPFCTNMYLDMVNTTGGAIAWAFLKPMLMGKILFTPDTPQTRAIMNKANRTLAQLGDLRHYSQDWIQSSNSIVESAHMLTLTLPLLQNSLGNYFVRNFIEMQTGIDVDSMQETLNTFSNMTELVEKNKELLGQITTLSRLMVNLSSCITFDRYEGHDTEDGLNKEAQDLAKNRSLYASVIFQLPKASDSSRRRRSASDAITLPPKVLYTIRMHMDNVMRTDRVRDPFFSKETHISARTSLRYNRGFIYLQETIDRAIIDIQTNKTVTDTAVQIQPFPYPCHHRDEYLEAISFVFPLLLMIAWVLFVADFVKKLVHEREMKLHEYMKMMGVSPLSHFFAWFLESAFYLILTIFFLTLVLKYGNIMPHSDGFLLFLYLCDYGLSILAFSFLVSTFFDKTYIAALSGSLLYVFAFFPFIVVLALEARVSFSVKNLLGLFSPTAFSYASQYVSRYETQGEGIQWSNSYSSPIAGDTASFGWLCWLMLIDTFLYFIIGAYIRTVFPGKSGIPSPWYFPFTASFWKDLCSCRKANKTSRGLFLTNIMQAHPPMFPDTDAKPKGKGDLSSKASENFSDLPVGVALYGLTKMYGQQAAIENLNVAFYEGHVTSLLGHNGAGKTTTMSILTGLFPPSSGTVEVYGRDMQANLEDVRKELGVCMQYDVLFDHMTTEEHLLLYGQIKAPHWSKRELQEQVYTILEETGMFAHRHKRVGTLSGGMKRKLSISIAFIGGSRLVVLDEPTTGVDPCSRRSIWDIVIQHKKGRTIIMSTHHLDEAEVLSDRIAFLERGGLKCCGSPYSLKDQLGQGYKLTLTKKVHSGEAKKIDNAELKAFVQAHVPEARLKEAQGSDLVYLLPPFTSNNAASYRSLLTALDSNLDALQLGCYGISDTTLEEVFLHLTQGSTATAGDELPTISETVSDTDSINSYPESEGSISDDKACFTGTPTVSGVKLLWQQMTAILIKRVHHSRRDWKGLLSQILLPVLFVAFAMGLGIIKSDLRHYPKLELSPALYKIGPSYSFFSNPSSNKLAETMLSYPGLDNTCLLKPNDQVCTRSTGAWTSSNGTKKLTLCKCRDENEVCGASGYVPPHKQIPSSQVVYNVTDVNVENYLVVTAHDYIRNRYGGYDFGLPLPQNLKMDVQAVPTNRTLSKVWFNPEGHHTMPAYLSSINNFILRSNLPADKDPTEYAISVSSHPYFGRPDEEDSIVQGMLQIMVAMCIMAGFSITTASFAIYEVNEHHSGSKRLQHIAGISEPFYWIVNFFYDMATYMIPVALTVAVIAIFQVPAFTDRQNLGAVAMLLVLFGFATFPWMYLLSGMFKDAEMAFITYVCINLFLSVNTIIPTSILYFMQQITDRNSKSLTGIFQRLSDAFLIFPQFNFGNGLLAMARVNIEVQILSGYGIDAYKDPFSTEALGWMMISSFIQGVVFFSLRLLLNKYIVRKIRRLILRRKSILLGPCVDEDEDVAAEHLRVSSGAASSDVLQVNQLTKVYQHLSKKVPAVKNLSLGVPAGECFGLLGVNGAGKTTTFKMLTGDVSPTAGTAQIRDRNGRLVDIMECRNQGINIGYCPQVDALDDLLTGEEHLYFYARLHGISKREIPGVVNYLLRKVELNHYRDIIADSYSCGTRRKLSTALALVGHPQILLLDEPSSGMDPRTKRQLWKIISEEVKGKCAVVLTSHSMEECEALCGRLAIMVKGQFRCLGSLQHIKNRFGSGFMVKMYLAKASSDAEAITRFMQSRFPSTYLKEQHSAMVEYHVPTAPGGVADIFGQLESSKEFLEIQHFSVSQTTLDEVFINFAMGKIGMQTIPIDEEIEDNSALKDVGA